ncbi:major capsid protein [Acidovorax sp. Root70]|jgi:hypothetical protein|uniref:major capsid protein n=1 Tax=Acidovorax sp. Root70 TaxID=1736590 RepID=UPI0006FE2F4D|nr:major capsid protein [Acidovorax sp. Root70]KRB35540.1 hypothetical protein ASD94_02735 [Acidovorax sp. Root70]
MSLFLRAKQAGARYVKNSKRVAAGAAVMALASSPAFAAAPAQPDVTEAVAYILATMATIALIGNARLLVSVTVSVFRWIRGAAR